MDPTPPFPFTAILGLESAVRSLLLHAVDPRLGGSLLLGHRGCAKSTIARSFGSLLAALEARATGEAFVEIPLGVSEDRLLGSVDAGALLGQGTWRPQPGLLEAAHGGVLYVDEINLLPDTLSDLLLDCAASGTYRMERDGISRRVPSRFILIGTMNPEEGELRPQLSDRFAHGVSVQSPPGAAQRMEIARRALDFEEDPEGFSAGWQSAERELLAHLRTARERLRQTRIPESIRLQVAEHAHHRGLEGLRAEMAVLRTVRAAAAWDGVAEALPRHLEEAWSLCLGHRTPPTPSQNTPPRPPAPPAPERRNPGADPSPKPGSGRLPSGSPEAPHTPHFPPQAHASPLPLPRSAPGGTIQPVKTHRELKGLPPHQPAAPLRGTASEHGAGKKQTLWHASLLCSLLKGWSPGNPGWRWIQKYVKAAPRLWIFLDASRSTGPRGSLEILRDSLLHILPKATRIRLLLLHGGEPRWLARDASARQVAEKLGSLASAAGGSPLNQAIRLLYRDMQMAPGRALHRAVVCSDGLPQPVRGGAPLETARQLRGLLRRLSQTLPGGAARWIAAPAPVALAGWLPRLLRNTGFALLEGKKLHAIPGEHLSP